MYLLNNDFVLYTTRMVNIIACANVFLLFLLELVALYGMSATP